MRDGDAPVQTHLARSRCACSARSASRSIPRPGAGTTKWSATARCPIVDTWWQTETGGILITPLPGAIDLKPGSATQAVLRRAAGDRRCQRHAARRRGRRQPGAARLLAGPDAHGLRRPPALHRHLLQDLSGHVLHRRRLPPRRRRLLLDHRPRRRRHQRQRPPHRHRGSRERAGLAPEGRRGRGGRLPARHQGPGHLRLRHPERRRSGQRRAAQGTGRARAQRDRPDRHARPPAMGAGPAEDALGQDHAPHPAQDRRERAGPARRHVARWPIRRWWKAWSTSVLASEVREFAGQIRPCRPC